MFLLVPAYPGSPRQKAVKRLCVRVCVCVCVIGVGSRKLKPVIIGSGPSVAVLSDLVHLDRRFMRRTHA